jgi:hypothetical protein
MHVCAIVYSSFRLSVAFFVFRFRVALVVVNSASPTSAFTFTGAAGLDTAGSPRLALAFFFCLVAAAGGGGVLDDDDGAAGTTVCVLLLLWPLPTILSTPNGVNDGPKNAGICKMPMTCINTPIKAVANVLGSLVPMPNQSAAMNVVRSQVPMGPVVSWT